MKLWYNRTSKDPTYFIQQGYRNGKKTSTRNVAVIGKHSELLKITDDPLEYAKQKVAEANEAMKNGKVTLEVKIDFDEKVYSSADLVSSSNLRNVGYFFLQAVYHDLGIAGFFKKVTADSRITFNPDTVNRFLTYARILDPASKLATFEHLDRYFEEPSFQYQHIHRTLDILAENYDAYLSHLFEMSSRVVKRNTSVCYFDCTNFYFEVETQDEDYVDEVTGEIIKGFRKYGPSKEHRPNPLVEMGLFMDAQGIPLSMCIASGSDSEQTITVPAEEKLVSMFKGKKFIYCADAGLGSFNIRKFNSMGGRAYVITQSIKKLPDKLKEAVFSDCDYRLLSDNTPVTIREMKEFDRTASGNRALYEDRAYKAIWADTEIDLGFYEEKKCKNGKTYRRKAKGIINQRIIITFSRKMMEYQRHIRNKQIERAKVMLGQLDPESYKKGPHDVTRFIKRTSTGTNGEKAQDSYAIDQSVIEEEEKYDGFYAVATNLDDDAATILEISAQRYKIEDCFRVMKTNFSSRPVYHHTKEHITAHFMICYTALLIYRLLEVRLDNYGKTLKEGAQHFTTRDIIQTMKNMNVIDLKGVCYMSTYNGSQILNALNAIYDLKLDRKYYQPKELHRKLKKIL